MGRLNPAPYTRREGTEVIGPYPTKEIRRGPESGGAKLTAFSYRGHAPLGEEGGGTEKSAVERHRQYEIRAIVHPVPFARHTRKSYLVN